MKTVSQTGAAPSTRTREVRLRARLSRFSRALFALAMSLLLWLYVASVRIPEAQRESIVYPDVPVQLRGLAENLLYVGAPPTVSVRVRDQQDDLVGIEDTGQPVAYLDLSGVQPGTRTVPVRIDGVTDAELVDITPAQVPVTLVPAVSESFPVEIEFLNGEIDPQTLAALQAQLQQVSVVGAAENVRRVRRVTAAIEPEDMQPGAVLPLVPEPVDRFGRPVADVTVNPPQIQVTLPAAITPAAQP